MASDCVNQRVPVRCHAMEPMTGVDPAFPAWKADALPLSYIGLCASRPIRSGIVVLCEDLRYAHISQERPDNWSRRSGLNTQHIAYKAIALPIELQRHG